MSYDVVILVGISVVDSIFERYAGPHRIATELRNNGYKVFILYGLNYYTSNELIDMCDRVIDNKTLCIGVSTTFLLRDFSTLKQFSNLPVHLENIIQILSHFKSKYKKLKAVAGGPTAKDKMQGINLFDAFFEGYSDTRFLQYLKDLSDNKIYLGQQHFRDLEAGNFDFKHSYINYENHDFIFPNECLPLEITRGCIFKCKFCNYPNIGKSPKDDSWVKSAQTLKQELINNYDNYGTKYYTFSDDTYNAGLDKVKFFHEVITRLPFQIKFSAFIRLDLLYRYPEMIPLLKESGLAGAYFGIETFFPYAKRTIGKGLEVSKILKTIEHCNKIWGDDVICLGSFIYGLPGETIETMRDWTEKIIIKSGLFDKMAINFLPLLLVDAKNSVKKLYTSEFDREYDLYGYEFLNDPVNPLRWKNQLTTYDECLKLSKEMSSIIYAIKRPYGSFKVAPLLGYGLTMDEISDIKGSKTKVSEITDTKYKIYKEKILNIT